MSLLRRSCMRSGATRKKLQTSIVGIRSMQVVVFDVPGDLPCRAAWLGVTPIALRAGCRISERGALVATVC